MTGRWLLTLEDSRLLRVGKQAERGHQAPLGVLSRQVAEKVWARPGSSSPGRNLGQPGLFFKHRQLRRAGRCTLGCAGRVF